MLNLDIVLNFKLSWEQRQDHIQSVMIQHGFSFLGDGRHRSAYLNPRHTCVIKLPRNKQGLDANRVEAWRYAKYKFVPEPVYGVVYAPCRLLKKSILVMLFAPVLFGNSDGDEIARQSGLVKCRDYYKLRDKQQLPKWIGRLDAQQAGILPSGRVVAYDFTTMY